ncbi:hypothetical protein PAN31117_04664 [Pandoraea anapnoica]|uniref:Uncharacterized protein n=1 Tax=Pandoraea anapnoica TaxID=2508301 RepID=A0A5E5AHV7_9BURK|nr:hypothetical protein PIN31009_04215 [Pandoraea iniqua]VVE73229.1 hypothetical protein PAN31117_04664 [Pandoraea anapnoica]
MKKMENSTAGTETIRTGVQNKENCTELARVAGETSTYEMLPPDSKARSTKIALELQLEKHYGREQTRRLMRVVFQLYRPAARCVHLARQFRALKNEAVAAMNSGAGLGQIRDLLTTYINCGIGPRYPATSNAPQLPLLRSNIELGTLPQSGIELHDTKIDQ